MVSGQKKAAEKNFRLRTYRTCGYPYGYPQLAASVRDGFLAARRVRLRGDRGGHAINVALARHWW